LALAPRQDSAIAAELHVNQAAMKFFRALNALAFHKTRYLHR
jgi:hypothetical protein